ncbi:MAG: mannose-1-phosphate guanylyltransferase, partial [Desulfobulbaceae bacterium]|nr:mannose-1-phosphate guanylyltransferase [Desulfobulbaceae bacterium]
MIIPVILSGGSGTRLWPLSRELYPKQLLALAGDQTLLQQTVTRLDGLLDTGLPIIVCNEEHRFLVAEQLRSLAVDPAAIILEPVGRNTAPATAVAAFYALKEDKNAQMLVLPADHLIKNVHIFQEAVLSASKQAEKKKLVTFGIVPDRPETGYGYIKQGKKLTRKGDTSTYDAFSVDHFVEKPNLRTAEKYLKSGKYFWNSGMFLFRAD